MIMIAAISDSAEPDAHKGSPTRNHTHTHTHTMPSTPARAAREEERREQSMEAARAANELKYTEFQLNCDAGSVGACTSLGEWLELMRGDTLAAVALYRPACFEKRYPQACYNFGKALGACGKRERAGSPATLHCVGAPYPHPRAHTRTAFPHPHLSRRQDQRGLLADAGGGAQRLRHCLRGR